MIIATPYNYDDFGKPFDAYDRFKNDIIPLDRHYDTMMAMTMAAKSLRQSVADGRLSAGRRLGVSSALIPQHANNPLELLSPFVRDMETFRRVMYH